MDENSKSVTKDSLWRRWTHVVVGERGIKVLSLAPGDANHEETDSAQHHEDHEKQKEDRPAGRISATGDHGDTAAGASEEMGDGIHEDLTG